MDQSSAKFLLERKDLHFECYPAALDFKRDTLFCDVILKAENKEIPAHRIILAATIPFFRMMFANNFQESNQRVILMQEIDADTLENLINVSYGGEIDVNLGNVEKLLPGANFLGLESVKEDLQKFLIDHLNFQNVLYYIKLAEKYNCGTLLCAAREFLDENFTDYTAIDDFLELQSQELIEIIKSDQLKAGSEENVYEAVMKWVKHAEPERILLLPEVLSHVRMCLLPPEFLYDIVRRDSFLQMSHACKDMLIEAISYYMLSATRKLPETTQSRTRNSKFDFIYIVDGEDEYDKVLTEICYYDPRKDKWTEDLENEFGLRSQLKFYLSASAVFDGKMYLFGGKFEIPQQLSARVMIFDVHTKRITRGLDMAFPTSGAAAAALEESIIVSGGSHINSHFDQTPSRLVQLYSPKLNSWVQIAPLNQNRLGHGSVTLNNEVYVIGGAIGSSSLNSCEKYDANSNTWTFIAPMLLAREFSGVAVLNGKIYVCGGCDRVETTNTMEVYDPTTNEWNFAAPMIHRRERFALIAYKNKLYAIGGWDRADDTSLQCVEAYDFSKNSWTFVKELPEPNSGMASGLIAH